VTLIKVTEIEQQQSTGFEKRGAGANGATGIGHVVQHAESVAGNLGAK